ncbi:MAG: hypothetical protein IAA97_01435, partial [Spirochaetes bacterium]|nr:hypothetical protein [Candidatus Ornithospirochaeta stercoripullorum]
MNKRIILSMFAAILLLFSSCDMFIATANPLIGYYKVSDTYGSKAAYYYYYLAEDGMFGVYQAGGAGSSDEVVYEGVWEYSLSHFDFFTASGSIILHTTSFLGNSDTSGLSLSIEEGNSNPFLFNWTLDKDTGITVLVLSTRDPDVCNLPGIAFSISEDEFERATGIIYNPDEPAPEEPGTEDPGTEEPGTEDPGTEEPGTEEPGTEEPGTEEPGTEEPGTEEPGTGEPGTEEPGTEEPGTEEPGTEEPGTEEPGTEEPGTEEPGTEEPTPDDSEQPVE